MAGRSPCAAFDGGLEPYERLLHVPLEVGLAVLDPHEPFSEDDVAGNVVDDIEGLGDVGAAAGARLEAIRPLGRVADRDGIGDEGELAARLGGNDSRLGAPPHEAALVCAL